MSINIKIMNNTDFCWAIDFYVILFEYYSVINNNRNACIDSIIYYYYY